MRPGRAQSFLTHIPPPVFFFTCLLAGWTLDRSWRFALGLDDLVRAWPSAAR